MTDLAQPARNGGLGPVRAGVPWTTALGNLLNLSGPLLVAPLCVLAGLLGFTTYASYGSDAALGIAVGAAAVGGITAVTVATGRCCGGAGAATGSVQEVVFVVWFT